MVKFYVAAAIIEKENFDVKAIKILAGSPRVHSFDATRVWVDCNIEDVVVLIPWLVRNWVMYKVNRIYMYNVYAYG